MPDDINSICPEAARLLQNCNVAPSTFAVLRKMKRLRQEEVAERMVAFSNYSLAFAERLLALTPPQLLVRHLTKGQAASRFVGQCPARAKKLQHEEAELARELIRLRHSYGKDVLTFTIYCKFVERLLANPRLEHYLGEKYPEALGVLRFALIGARVRTTLRRRIVTIVR